MKDAGLRIRVQRDLREKFLEICRAQDKPAAQVLREFMREYVIEHEAQLPDLDQFPLGGVGQGHTQKKLEGLNALERQTQVIYGPRPGSP